MAVSCAGSCATKSRNVCSGWSPTAAAYDRTNPREKMPPGSRATSFASSASSAPTGILVVFAISRTESCFASRAARSRDPTSVGVATRVCVSSAMVLSPRPR